MKRSDNKTLVIGVGNSGRSDDGLGWAFLDAMDKEVASQVDREYRYQLQVEDAELISYYEEVYFVDADRREHPDGYHLRKARPRGGYHFSTHQLHPQTVLYLVSRIYHRTPDAYILGISGKSFELKQGLTDFAQKNLVQAMCHFSKRIKQLQPD